MASATVYVRVTTSTTQPDTFDAAIQRFAASTIPIVMRKPGILGLIVLGNRSNSKVLTLSLWASEQDRNATNTDPEILADIASYRSFLGGTFARDAYVVVVDTWKRGGVDATRAPGFARVTTAQFQAGNWEEGIALLRAITSRPAGEPPDYLGSLALADPSSGKMLVVEAWRSRAALAAHEATVFRHDRMARDQHMLETRPVHETYRIHYGQ
jgi:heme-degrading monooxygenase HmoA